MTKNTGKPAQKDFETRIAALGKRAFLHRFDDASDIRGKTGAAGYAKKQPSDYLLTLDGRTAFTEVKSSEDQNSFRFAQLEEGQTAAAKKQTAAGGAYDVIVYSIALSRWFIIQWGEIAAIKTQGKASIKWKDMREWAI